VVLDPPFVTIAAVPVPQFSTCVTDARTTFLRFDVGSVLQ
jgi:hypothetical protein